MLVYLNPFYSGGPFHCYTLDESICHRRCIGSILFLLLAFILILVDNPVSKHFRPSDATWRLMAHYAASDGTLRGV